MSNKEKNENALIHLGLQSIEVKEFSIKSLSKDYIDSIREELKFNFNSSIKTDKRNNKVTIVLNITVRYTKESKTFDYIVLTTEFIFIVKPLKNIVANKTVDGKKVEVFTNEPIFLSLLGIAYSTIRGIFFEKVSNTPFNKLLVPVIDPRFLIQNKVSN